MPLGMGIAGDTAYALFAVLGALIYYVVIIAVVIVVFLILMRVLGGGKSPRAATRAVSKDIFGRTKSFLREHASRTPLLPCI